MCSTACFSKMNFILIGVNHGQTSKRAKHTDQKKEGQKCYIDSPILCTVYLLYNRSVKNSRFKTNLENDKSSTRLLHNLCVCVCFTYLCFLVCEKKVARELCFVLLAKLRWFEENIWLALLAGGFYANDFSRETLVFVYYWAILVAKQK